VVRTLGPTDEAFSIFRWLLWLSPVLVLVSVVLATSRSTSRAS
jgi:cytochrome c-type biogenesis protein CcmH/NrfF